MKNSIYKNQCHQLRVLFDQAKSPNKVLCVPIDYAKSKHVGLICDGYGNVLKNPFTIHNNQEGVEFLIEQVSATASRRKIPQSQIFFGGEDLPTYAENFTYQIGKKGYLVTRVNAKKAKENRENEIASTDNLALLGIAKTLLSRRARVIADPSETDDPDIYKSIVNLSRSRGRWVKHSTAIANQIHTHVDQLFPGFLNPLQTSITPFTEVSLDLMSSPRFSADQFARRKPVALAKTLKTRRVNNPEEKARILIELARQALKPNPQHIVSQQQTLQAAVELYRCSQRVSEQLNLECAALLASTPYAFITSIPGIGLTIACGCSGELGNPNQLPKIDNLCSYSGIAPRIYQTGGPDNPAQPTTTPKRCNRVLKHWVNMACLKMNRWSDDQWKARHSRWESNGQNALYGGSKRFLRLTKTLVTHQVAYQSPEALQSNASNAVRAADAERTWANLVRKWNVVPNYQEVVFAEDKPLGFWRKVMIDMYDVKLPLPPR